MMNEEKLRSIAVKAFNGSDFYISTYRGNPYLTEIKENKLYLFSQNSLNQKSTENDGIFATKIKIEDLTGVFHGKLYATYRNVEFEVLNVEKGLERLTLKGREDHISEDIGLGFAYKRMSEDQFDKQVKFKEIDGIRVIREDVYKEFEEKYGHKPYDFSAPAVAPKLSVGALATIAIINIIFNLIKDAAEYELKHPKDPYRPVTSTSVYEPPVSVDEIISKAHDGDDDYAKTSNMIKDHELNTEEFLKEYEDLLEKGKKFFEKYDASDYTDPEVAEQYNELIRERLARKYLFFSFRNELSDEYYADFLNECDRIDGEFEAIWEYSNETDN